MERLRSWFEKRDYWQGVELYKEYGNNNFLKELFQSGPSQYNSSKLLSEMTALTSYNSETNSGSDEIIESESKSIHNPFLLVKLRHELQQVFRQIDQNMFKLDQARSDSTRKEYAFQILRLQRKKQSIYDNIEYVEEHGALPVSKPKEYVTPLKQRLYVQIWKLEQRLKKKVLRNRAKTENLLAEKKAELERIRMEE